MKYEEPIFDPATQYRIELRGRVDLEWLQSFDRSIEIVIDEPGQQGFSVLRVQADQSGLIGLLRRLHGLGMTILKVQISQESRKE